MQRLRRFAKYWDLVGNSGNFVNTTLLIWSKAPPVNIREHDEPALGTPVSDPAPFNRHQRAGSETGAPVLPESPFASFLRLSDWLYARIGRTDSIALARLAELLFGFLTSERALPAARVAAAMADDWQRTGRREVPEFLREFLPAEYEPRAPSSTTRSLKRQARHLAGNT
jgi:hypothetical protein